MDQAAPPLFAFDNSYQRLPERFYARLQPTPVKTPALLRLNDELAAELGLDAARLRAQEGVEMLAGNKVPANADPIAMAYAGHQFGNFVPQLGDGRAILLGELIDRDGARRDIHLKGAGRTPFSRSGDGRAAIGPVLREYLVSEAMFALGVPTSRALAALSTGEKVFREQMLPGALIVRTAASHIRIGTFQYFAARDDELALRMLADHVIERHYPDLEGADQPYAALLAAIVERQAQLVAKWLHVGFIHGVMNTDNMTVSGETVDYGPCAFMDHYHPGTVFSSIDAMGRYAYKNQSRIAHWNLLQLANALLPLLGQTEEAAVEAAEAVLQTYPGLFAEAWLSGMRAKLGFERKEEGDKALGDEFLNLLQAGEVDFTNAFRALCAAAEGEEGALQALLPEHRDELEAWHTLYIWRLSRENRARPDIAAGMRAVNPAFIPRNHLVERALEAAQAGDLSLWDELHETLRAPFDDQPGKDHLQQPPEPHEVVAATFCGT